MRLDLKREFAQSDRRELKARSVVPDGQASSSTKGEQSDFQSLRGELTARHQLRFMTLRSLPVVPAGGHSPSRAQRRSRVEPLTVSARSTASGPRLPFGVEAATQPASTVRTLERAPQEGQHRKHCRKLTDMLQGGHSRPSAGAPSTALFAHFEADIAFPYRVHVADDVAPTLNRVGS
jgi:hypothetical protein